MRKTKIVCTLGPASEDPVIMKNLILAGMNVARFNFSHGTHESHKEMLDKLKKVREEVGSPVAALLDTKGPEIRLGEFQGGSVQLKAGDPFTLTTKEGKGNNLRASITYKGLPNDIEVGQKILLDDGLIELKVEGLSKTDILCKVISGGIIKSKKGVNLPGVSLSLPYISEQDKADVPFGIKEGFDFIAASFVRSADDVMQIRSLLWENGGNHIRIISKIENAQGVENIDEILSVSDGIMVARGDMGVEIPFEEVPIWQKVLIQKGFTSGKQVITATQMLESMVSNPRPTRAEATDVANAIYDGTSAVMLSGETAAGKYPVEAVKTMALIARRTEEDINYEERFYAIRNLHDNSVTDAISHATCTIAYDLKAAAIITVTKSGDTAKSISKYRPSTPIIACTTSEQVMRQINMSWDVTPVLCENQPNTDQLFEHAVNMAVKAGYVQLGDLVVITAGVPVGQSGTTNLLKVHVVGESLVGMH